MIITDYYCFRRKPGMKSKMRINCTASTMSYEPFEGMRSSKNMNKSEKRDGCRIGELFIYLGKVPQVFGGDIHEKAGWALTKGKNISSIIIPDPEINIGHGDMKGTSDALLFVFSAFQATDGELSDNLKLEIFVARGQAANQVSIYRCMASGEYDDVIEKLRKKALKE